MTELRISAVDEVGVSALDAIIKAYQYKDYRRFPSVNDKAGVKYTSGLTMEMLARDGAESWFAYLADVPVGFTVVSPLDWDSDYFGLRMARLAVIVAEEQSTQVFAVADQLLSTALKATRQKGIQHLSLRVDAEDIGLVHALEKHGFRLMDTLFANAFHMGKSHLPDIRPRYDLRLYRPEDYEIVLDIATTSFKRYPNRFSTDPHIPRERAQTFYREWAKNSCQGGTIADTVLVAERRGRVVGFLSYRFNPALRRYTGVRIITDGLIGCYPFRFNAYLDLLREATRRSLTIADAIEAEVQLFNMAATSYCGKLGFSLAGAKHSFHRWLDA